jgi:glycolate oxidase FAD binding subunit
LWRLAVKPTTPPLNLGDAQWIEWGGAVRWMASDRPATTLREAAKAAGGHATLFRGDTPPDGAFTPLSPALATLHRNLKQRFDPRGIFNHGRLYPDF